MEYEELKGRLAAINEMIENVFDSNTDMLLSTQHFLKKIQQVALGKDENIPMKKPKELKHVIISCDASITKNPGGDVAVGVVIEDRIKDPIHLARKMKNSSTNNQGEYDAIYFGLTEFMALNNNPQSPIEIRSDSLLVIDQLLGKKKCNSPELKRRKESILELVKQIPVPVHLTWRPRNSTTALEEANYLAQDILGVPRH